jgi:hypothetical protein
MRSERNTLIEEPVMKIATIAGLGAIVALAACGRTDDGRVTVERPGDVDVHTTTDTLPRVDMPDVDIGTRKDTINVPTVDVNKRPVEVTRPTVTTKP